MQTRYSTTISQESPTNLHTSSLTSQNLATRKRLREDTCITRTRRDLRRLITIVIALVGSADPFNVGDTTRVVDGGSVAIVTVHASKFLARDGDDVGHLHIALGHLVAVSAGAVELAEVVDGEAVDGEGAAGVVLFN